MKDFEKHINSTIVKLFQQTVKRIEKQTSCEHDWKDKNGTANYVCKKCKYVVNDLKLDNLIYEMKLNQKGFTNKHKQILKEKL